MSTPVRVAGFLALVAATFAVATLVGSAVGPVAAPASEAAAHGTDPAATGGHQATTTAAPAEIPGGLMTSQHGYTLRPAQDRLQAGRDVPVMFTIEGPDGRPVLRYDVQHEKRLHLIAVRRDFTGFQHVHPDLGDDGTWSTGLDLTPGEWRLFADFKPADGPALTLGSDLSVPGHYQPESPSTEVRTAHVDGYTVTLEGDVRAGADARLTATVSRDGRPVTDLQPYLGAYGHLVALREGDLAYLHVHPDGHPGDGATEPGPEVVFHANVPSEGAYRLYLDFKHDGEVRTAEFAVATSAQATSGSSPPNGDAGHAEDGHGH